MGRPRGSKNVTDAERRRIRQLFRQGVRVEDIIRQTGRCESVVYRVTCDMTRTKPRSPGRPRNPRRDAKILELVLVRGWSQSEAARKYGLTPSRISHLVCDYRAKQERERRRRRAARRRAR